MNSTDPENGACARDRQRLIVLLIMVAAVAAIIVVFRRGPTPNAAPTTPVVREFAIFDTYGRFTLWTDPDTAEKALADCAEDLRHIHRTLNNYDEHSELSQLNRQAAEAPFVCSDLLWDVLRAAREGYQVSAGAFDVSVGPLMALWGFHRKRDTMPTDREIEATLETVGLNRIRFDDSSQSVRFEKAGMRLDLGGIAKGYALDRTMTILRHHGITRALVDLGGNIGCTELPPPERETFYVGIRNPFDTSTMMGRMRIRGKAVASSGNYERRVVIQDRTVGHIIDPTSGRPAKGPAGVTAVTPRGVDSDVFSTAVFVRGEEMARECVRNIPGTGFVLISGTPRDVVRTTVGDVGLVPEE